MNFIEKLEFFAKYIGGFITIYGLIKGYIEYRNAQKWKRLEFLAQEMKDFFSNPCTQRMMKVLDYRNGELFVLPTESDDLKKISFDQDILLSGFSIGKTVNELTAEDRILRAIIDGFLDNLCNYNRYIETGLITKDDLWHYLKYWLNILGNPESGKRSKTVMKQIWAYIDHFNYTDVRDLIQKFGMNPEFIPDT
jgi:hypothetical protein